MHDIEKSILRQKEGILMESYDFLLFVAVILLSTKIFSLLSQKVNMPQVVGCLLYTSMFMVEGLSISLLFNGTHWKT